MKLPTTRQLQYFVTLVETEHFGKAAERCFVSQSAFSNAIRELETTLGTQLVDRTNRNVTITSIGRQVARQARQSLEDIETLVDLASGQRKPLSGELRFGVIPTIAPFMLPKALPALRKAYPELKALLVENQTEQLCQMLADGRLDVVLLALPYALKGTEVMELFDDPFLLAYRAGTELVDPDKFRPDRLDANTVLLLEDGHCLRDHAMIACKIRGMQCVQEFSATSLLTLVEMVDADLGISFLPEMAYDSALLKNTSVKLQPVKGSSFRTIALAWRKGSGRCEEFRELGEFLRERYHPPVVK
jgi:LysR family hydrogen peroxide-inducible transcriptional activator